MNIKFLLFSSLCFLGSNAFSQVGIGTDTPITTLEVVGKPNDVNIPDGIKFPNLTIDELIQGANSLYSNTPNTLGKYNPNSKGTIIYITEVGTLSSDVKFKYITKPGAYYYDGTTWQAKSSVVSSDIIEYASEEEQSLRSFTLPTTTNPNPTNERQNLTFRTSEEIISNGKITLSGDGTYFTISEDGMYEVYGYVGVFPNLTMSGDNFSEASAAIVLNNQTIISEGSETFIGNMTKLVNMITVPNTLVVLKSGDKIYFTIHFKNVNITTVGPYFNQGYDNSLPNITTKIGPVVLQKYSKYITIRKI